jgi:hypothetical protein
MHKPKFFICVFFGFNAAVDNVMTGVAENSALFIVGFASGTTRTR